LMTIRPATVAPTTNGVYPALAGSTAGTAVLRAEAYATVLVSSL
jgi:hypothetical protein